MIKKVPADEVGEPALQVGSIGRVIGSSPIGEGGSWAWLPEISVPALEPDPTATHSFDVPEAALKTLGLLAVKRDDGGYDEIALDPADHAAAFWDEISLQAYTALTHRRAARRVAKRVERALWDLGLFSRVELAELERHWHAPEGRHPAAREYRLWFRLGAEDAPHAFEQLVRRRHAGWDYDDDDGHFREAVWLARDDQDEAPFLDSEVVALQLWLKPRRDPRPRA